LPELQGDWTVLQGDWYELPIVWYVRRDDLPVLPIDSAGLQDDWNVLQDDWSGTAGRSERSAR